MPELIIFSADEVKHHENSVRLTGDTQDISCVTSLEQTNCQAKFILDISA